MKWFKLFILFFNIAQCEGFSQEIAKIRIDPAQAHGGSISEYFQEIEYIPLETTKESLFGSISQLITTNKSYIIHDWDTKSILFFDLSGKFRKRIKEAEHTQLNIFLDEEKQILRYSVYNIFSRKAIIKSCSLIGSPIPSEQMKIADDIGHPLVSLGSNYYVSLGNCHLRRNEKALDSTFYGVTIYTVTGRYKSFLPINQMYDIGKCSLKGYLKDISIVRNGSFYISTPLDHYLYKVNKDTAKLLYQFIFPSSRTIPKEVYLSNNRKTLDSMWVVLSDDQNFILDVSNLFFEGSRLFFKVNTRVYTSLQGSEMKDQYNFIYDTINQKLVSLERLVPDQLSFNLPFLGNEVRVSGLTYYDRHFYTSLSSLKLFSEYEKNKSRNPQYSPVLQEYFRTQNRKSNPVIVRMKLKE